MKINDRYEIRVVVVGLPDGRDVYDDFREFKKKFPHGSYRFGFAVFDTENNRVPENCNSWNDSPEEALFDFEENCQQNPETGRQEGL